MVSFGGSIWIVRLYSFTAWRFLPDKSEKGILSFRVFCEDFLESQFSVGLHNRYGLGLGPFANLNKFFTQWSCVLVV